MEKLQKIANLCKELQAEDNEVIVESRIEGLAQELGVNPAQVAICYWALKMKDGFKSCFGSNVRIRLRAK